jgi:hypothetical protein
VDRPAISTVKKICYGSTFSNKATAYGCKHEKDAIVAYHFEMELSHQNFAMKSSGLILNNNYPKFGATPDSLVSFNS